MATLSAITIYPIKSCGGIALNQAGIGPLGLALDRHWMLVDEQGQFLTQRSHAAMACITPRFDAGELCLTAPGMAELRLPLEGADGEQLAVTVWKDTVIALDQGARARAWFSAYLGVNARLVRFKPDVERVCSARWTGEHRATTQFSDGYPLLVIGQASLQDLNARLAAKGAPALPMERFRPNLVIDGLDAYEEDFVDTIRLGEGEDAVELKLVKPCARCPVPGIDQRTGLRDAQWPDEPMDTLAAYRANERVGGGLTFGQNAIVSRIGGEIRVGQACSWEFNF
ncbi:MOSC N-terminal beta barrel domain-containing protein [Herbaspirillum sp. LeCh32-8]|uniref:MOSC domain-containing protein n=1 Tax=Herbaspirillum sp. LeCh32-8 TaxID=2821356 RepID=UPI001AE1C7AE|nr:MOSC N-terminal beta barrel domain-containing protein [Herbaspirillum sp. LeCh32-8]MBP0599446.1 MOSC N-terminal beta barrel domain-containing protein [Herbaspirillum sp. LeCh32-8]